MLRDQTTPSVGLIRRALSTTCAQFDFTTTLYSTICDLANQKVLLYHFHNFEEVVVLDLKKELAKGASNRSIPDLFQVHPYSCDGYPWVGRQLGDVKLQTIIDEKGIQEGLRAFPALKDQKRTYPRYIFQDWVIKNAALHYLAIDKLDIAIEQIRSCHPEQLLFPQPYEFGKEDCGYLSFGIAVKGSFRNLGDG